MAGINTGFFLSGGGRGGGMGMGKGADTSLARLIWIAIEGPELSVVNFEDILEVFKEKKQQQRITL